MKQYAINAQCTKIMDQPKKTLQGENCKKPRGTL